LPQSRHLQKQGALGGVGGVEQDGG
jgi:hypothetical protein